MVPIKLGDGPVKMRLEKKGRGGKVVTVLWNIPLNEEEARNLMKAMQNQFGCGASLKAATIELQGDRCQQVELFFTKSDLNLQRAGG